MQTELYQRLQEKGSGGWVQKKDGAQGEDVVERESQWLATKPEPEGVLVG